MRVFFPIFDFWVFDLALFCLEGGFDGTYYPRGYTDLSISGVSNLGRTVRITIWTTINVLRLFLRVNCKRAKIQSGHRDKNIPGLTRVPYDLRFSLVFVGFPDPFKALVSYRPVLMAVAWL